ncbi:ST8SIA6 [Branchiostoma lanceolatum]|uniref:ST8SIA6 protein n=1 Tax=Branchiostoma lanceolatum TaxID=7740 RepID=A0A8J9VF93_BRALA|nr:ST8SIA6 [Branchiostoma lanceolatum]
MAKVRIHRTFTLGFILVSMNVCFMLILQRCVVGPSGRMERSERDVIKFESLPLDLNADDNRQKILDRTRVNTHLYCSKLNIPVHSNLSFFESKKVIKVMRGTHQHLPREVTFPETPYRTCTVVGNSGVLLNSRCAKEIESSDYIFRLNLPPVGGIFTRDVGQRAHFVTINPSILTERFKYLTEEDYQNAFIRSVLAYRTNTTFYTHPFHNPLYRKTTYRAMFLVRDRGNGSVVRWSHPDFLRKVNDFWKKTEKGIKAKRITSGLMVTTFALSMCEETHLYGFWPYGTDLKKKNAVPYHYFKRHITVQHKVINEQEEIFRRIVDKNLVHNMEQEFNLLVKMHEKRLLRLHVKPCKRTR